MTIRRVLDTIGRRRILGGVAVASIVAVGLALVSQYVFGMLPCPWCVLQRLIFVAVAVAALPGAVSGARMVRIASGIAVAALSAAGAASAGWQHFVAARNFGCNFTLADRIITRLGLDAALPDVFAPLASCAEAAATLVGIPYEFFSLALFGLFAVLAGFVVFARPGR